MEKERERCAAYRVSHILGCKGRDYADEDALNAATHFATEASTFLHAVRNDNLISTGRRKKK